MSGSGVASGVGRRVRVLGAGPAGLFSALCLRTMASDWTVEVVETRPEWSGLGLVVPSTAFDMLTDVDRVLAQELRSAASWWSKIRVCYRGEVVSADGPMYCTIPRYVLLEKLAARCLEMGVRIHQGHFVGAEHTTSENDILVAADGAGSATRARLAHHVGPRVTRGRCIYSWVECPPALDGFTFAVVETRVGPVTLHSYPSGADCNTTVVEMHEDVWRRAFGHDPDRANTRLSLPRVLAADLAGGPIAVSKIRPFRWRRFMTVQLSRWHHGNVVLIGDAAHATHFSIGSGTQLALEDAIELARSLNSSPETSFERFEARRKPPVRRTQEIARESQAWFENLAQNLHPDPLTFGRSLLARTSRSSGARIAATAMLEEQHGRTGFRTPRSFHQGSASTFGAKTSNPI